MSYKKLIICSEAVYVVSCTFSSYIIYSCLNRAIGLHCALLILITVSQSTPTLIVKETTHVVAVLDCGNAAFSTLDCSELLN